MSRSPATDGTETDTTPRRERTGGNTFLGDVAVNFKRWAIKATRNRFFLVGTLVQPIIFFVLFTQVFGQVATQSLGSAAGGSGVNYETFLLPAIAMQVSLATAAGSGIGLVNDIENGMFEKTLVSPMSRTAVFVGKSAAEIMLIVIEIGLILGLGVLMGARIETGLAGAVGVALVGIVFSVWFTGYSNVLAVLTRDQESTILAANMLQFPLLFVSSAFLPLEAMPGWIQTIAAFNPVTYGADAARALVLSQDVSQVFEVTAFGGMWNTIVPAVAILVVVDVLLGGLAVFMLQRASRAAV
jgi:ABC-2 type transport system permease protein